MESVACDPLWTCFEELALVLPRGYVSSLEVELKVEDDAEELGMMWYRSSGASLMLLWASAASLFESCGRRHGVRCWARHVERRSGMCVSVLHPPTRVWYQAYDELIRTDEAPRSATHNDAHRVHESHCIYSHMCFVRSCMGVLTARQSRNRN